VLEELEYSMAIFPAVAWNIFSGSSNDFKTIVQVFLPCRNRLSYPRSDLPVSLLLSCGI
jgi:hypothetical protein